MIELSEWMLTHRLGSQGQYRTTILESPFVGQPSLQVTVYDALPPERFGFDTRHWRWAFVDLDGGRPVEFWFEFAGNVDRLTIAQWSGLLVVDSAFPQSWGKEYEKQHGEWPDAMWAYEWLTETGKEKNVLGQPVFMRDILNAVKVAIYYQLRREGKFA